MTLQKIQRLPLAFTIGLMLVACRPWSSDMMKPGEMMDRSRGRSSTTPEVTPAPTATQGGSAKVSYRQQIQPLLDRKCVGCHGGQAGLFMNSYDNLMAGGPAGKIVIPGDPEDSELVRRIRGLSQPRMPLDGSTLASPEIDMIVTWIAEGSPNN